MGIFRGISNHLNKHFRDERGGVFSFLLGGVALLAVVTFGLYQVLSGPVTSGARVQGTLLAQHQLMTNARIASADAVEVIGDCDGDGAYEPRPFRTATGPAPTNGGHVPMELGGQINDGWGTPIGYCAWDTGSVSGDAGCGGATANRLDGNDDTTTGNYGTRTMMAMISAGPDRQFDTDCAAYSNGTTDVITTSGDDIVFRFTYPEALAYLGQQGVLSAGGGSGPTTPTDRDCNLPWNGTIAHGSSVLAYQAPGAYSCSVESRTCNDGDLSGSFGFENCNDDYVRMFITSQTWTGNLGGISGADAKCQTAASNAGHTGTFRAWISDSSAGPGSDYYYYKHDGPYVNYNDQMIAIDFNRLTDTLSTDLYTPPNVTELATTQASTYAWTHVYFDGQADASQHSCNGFTSASSSDRGMTGQPTSTSSSWTRFGTQYCDNAYPIYCLEQKAFTPPAPKKVFVTADSWNGNLGGVAGADAKCAAAASTAGLAGSYKAWISTSSYSPATSSSFYKHTGPYITLNNKKIADDFTDLTSGSVQSVVDVDQNGTPFSTEQYTWTGTRSSGTLRSTSYTCNNWTTGTSGSSGWRGSTNRDNKWWTDFNMQSCDNTFRLYCLEQ